VIDPAAKETGKNPQGDPRDERERHCRETDKERDLRTDDDATEQIAPQIVGTQRVRPRRPVHHIEGHLVRIVGCDRLSQDGRNQEDGKNVESELRLAVGPDHGAELPPASESARRLGDLIGEHLVGHSWYRMRGSITV
jgi:hypothetical protein